MLALRANPPVFAPEGRISATDVQQGKAGTCYFLASLASLAEMRPELVAGAVRQNGDGSFSVRLYEGGAPVEVTVPAPEGPAENARDAEGDELWPRLFEEALRIHRGKGEIAAVDGGSMTDALQLLTGWPVERHQGLREKMTPEQAFERVREAVEAGHPVVVNTYTAREVQPRSGLRPGHVYSVLGARIEDGEPRLLIRDPYGTGDPTADGADNGLFWFEAKWFVSCFKAMAIAAAPEPPTSGASTIGATERIGSRRPEIGPRVLFDRAADPMRPMPRDRSTPRTAPSQAHTARTVLQPAPNRRPQ